MTRWDPQDYHNSSSQQQKWATELISKLHLRGDEDVLDIGCGDGRVTSEIARLVPAGSVLGVDRSIEMIQFAARHYPAETIPNLRFAVADARELPFCGQFDVVFSNAALHWVFDHRPVLRGIRNALKPGGRCLLQMGGAGNAAGILSLLDVLLAREPWRELFDGFEFRYGFHHPHDYRVWLEEAGLRPCRAELIPKDMIQQGPDGLAAWVRTTWLPYTERVPPERRADFIDEVVSQYVLDHPADAEGNVHVGMVRLEVEAKRSVAALLDA